MTKKKSDLWNHLIIFAESEMERHKIPGAAIGITHDGERFTGGLGVTSIDNPLPVTETTLFQVGSITKTFTATLIMRLVDQEELTLDTRVREILPEFKLKDQKTAEKCTIRHLLTHSGGWVGDFFIDTGPGEDALDKYVKRMAELDQVVPIGSQYSYNNAGFCLLGLIIERILKKPFQQVLNEVLLSPLGLENSYIIPTDVMTKRFAVGHLMDAGVLTVAEPWPIPRYAGPAGGLACDVGDLLSYAQFHMDGKTSTKDPILEPETRALMGEKQLEIRAEKEFLGLSWFADIFDGKNVISHGGGTHGQKAILSFLPEAKTALAVLANSDQGGQFIQAIWMWWIKKYLNLKIPPLKTIEVNLEQMKEIEGRYFMPRVGYMDIAVLGDTLVAQDVYTGGFPTEDTPPPPAPPPYRIGFTDIDRLVILDGVGKDVEGQVIRDKSGDLNFLRLGGRLHPRDK